MTSRVERTIRTRLAYASIEYMGIGLREFHNSRGNPYIPFQGALGNLSVSVELMLKTLVAKRAFLFVFEKLPVELQVKLAYPKEAKANPLTRHEELELLEFAHHSASLKSCIEMFYILEPKQKQTMKPFLDLFAQTRNSSVHGIFKDSGKYELERIAYLVIVLAKMLKAQRVLGFTSDRLTPADEKFFGSYDDRRVERVREAERTARARARTSAPIALPPSTGWSTLVYTCPVCESDGMMQGFTDMFWDDRRRNDPGTLYFYADGFKCSQCGLQLLDRQELELVGMEDVVERTRDHDRWVAEENQKFIDLIRRMDEELGG